MDLAAHALREFQATDFVALRRLGSGAYGEVLESRELATGRVYALKRVYLRLVTEAVFPIGAFRELLAHHCLQHPNIVAFHGYFTEATALVLVLDAHHCDLSRVVEGCPSGLSEARARPLLRDLLQGLAHCHAMGLLHRDVKPANMLVSREGRALLCDLGLARPFRSGGLPPEPPHFLSLFTAQVSSRWYRAPEVLYNSRAYGPAMDMWALGMVAAEMLAGRPLCAGGSDLEQLALVVALLGSPEAAWPGVTATPDWDKLRFHPCTPRDLAGALGGDAASPLAVDFISQLLRWDPATRLTAEQALAHAFLHEGLPSLRCAAEAVAAEAHEAGAPAGEGSSSP
jgi:cell cycle related kinase